MTIDLKLLPLLAQINSSNDLRALSEKQLPELAGEMREFLYQSLDISGGHFAGNLGTVELTIALHYIYDTPNDQLVWDVGHQAYPHKILTGRRDKLYTIRKADGLAAFPSREESEYDSFGVGHSSTSISAALGMALAAEAKQSPQKNVAIIGDGALTAGMAFEALNHAGDLHADLLVILNDNEMSISKNVGGLSNYLARILSGKVYSSMRAGSKKLLQKMPSVWEFAKRTEEHLKGMVIPGTLFEELGFNYIGPIDGHDLPVLLRTLKNLRKLTGPRFLHVVTKKGKGYAPAETDPIKFHAVNPGFYNKEKLGETKTINKPAPTYSAVFGQWLCDMAEKDPDLVGITPAMREGSGMVEFSARFPKRYYDVCIAEQHAVTLAAGLACGGMKPVVAIYSTFLQRAYDQLIHDVVLQNLSVLFAIDRAGLVGGDDPTHSGSFDLSYLRCLPNLIIMAPADENECRQMLYTGFQYNGPAAVRYPRGSGPQVNIDEKMQAYPIGKAEERRKGKNIVILAFGSMVTPACVAGENLNATVINMRFIKPLDTTLLDEISTSHSLIITVEENMLAGGAGSAVNEYLLAKNTGTKILNLGLPDKFLDQGDAKISLAECGLDAKGIEQAIRERL